MELPFDVKGQIIYYVGPCPAVPGRVIGPAGPTTSGRMDAYSLRLIEKGLACMIGKGMRNDTVINSMICHGAVYLAAEGGSAALISKKVISETHCFRGPWYGGGAPAESAESSCYYSGRQLWLQLL